MGVTDGFRIDGRVALVTGASAGLGAHFARTLAAAGAHVALAARRVERCEETVTQIEADGGRAVAVALDVTEPGTIASALDEVGRRLGIADVLVNNAGVVVTKPLLEQDADDWQRVVDTNLTGAWRVAQETAKRMVAAQRGGSIVNIASILGLRVMPQAPGYVASKAGLAHLTRAMALELARHGVRVNAIAPGYIETDMNRDFFASEAGVRMIKRIPQRRIGTPADLDGVLLLLASDASSFMTGAVVAVDGGHLVSSL